ncbi:MAG: GNAT family N-acetyltransferase [Lachnospiraceae bacterium]|nr:GNAT family N-acetyltransferase [Lachnospiraceae bacterium]
MDLSKYDERHVRLNDIYGETFTGIADYFSADYNLHEYGKEEDCLRIGEYLIFESQIASIEEIEVHGTAELRTERLILRRYLPEDALELYKEFGTDPTTYEYTGWNPYATLEMARETVRRFIAAYDREHFYGWVMDSEDVLFGTIGAYDYMDGRIEIGFSVIRPCRGRGYATEALKTVLEYLTENEGISCVTAWCAAENAGSRTVMEKAGMRLARVEKGGLVIGEKVYDKMIYEYGRQM